jgi:adenylosuccinate lyase
MERRLQEELPFLATEEILMAAVERGASRQDAHEIIRDHSVAAGHRVKAQGLPNDLLDRLAEDEGLPLSGAELAAIATDPSRFIGRAAQQVEVFLESVVKPRLARYGEPDAVSADNRVKV